MPNSASIRMGEIHHGMSKRIAISAPPPSLMKPQSMRTLRSPRASTKEKGTSITPSPKAPWIRLATGWLRLRAYSKTNNSHCALSAISFLRKNPPEAAEPHREDEDRALEDELRPGRRAEDRKPVEADRDDEDADE